MLTIFRLTSSCFVLKALKTDALPVTFQAVDRPLERLQLALHRVESRGELALQLEECGI